MLADFADAASPAVHRVAYEQLVAEPQKLAAETIAFLGLEAAEDLTHFELRDSALAKSDFGDRKIMETQAPHAHSVGKWETEFPPQDLQILVDAVGAELFRRLGYEPVLACLAELGVAEPSAETTAVATRPVEAIYARRVASVQAVCTLRGTGIPGPSPRDLASLFSNPFVSLMVEVNGWQQKIIDLRKEIELLNKRTADAEALAQEKVQEMEGTSARMHGLEVDLAQANDMARNLRDQLTQAASTSAQTADAAAPSLTSSFAARASADPTLSAPSAKIARIGQAGRAFRKCSMRNTPAFTMRRKISPAGRTRRTVSSCMRWRITADQ